MQQVQDNVRILAKRLEDLRHVFPDGQINRQIRCYKPPHSCEGSDTLSDIVVVLNFIITKGF